MRMLFMMAVSLYTSRVVLSALGVKDYGVYDAVAGFLSMFGIITSSMSSAISRCITVELGRNNVDKLKTVFSTAIAVQIIMGLIVVCCIETGGIWFVHNKMNIPPGREDAALWVLHCSTISTFLSLLNIPFKSAIVAHEKMSAFAYMSILEASLKLGICYALYISTIDNLKLYSSLLLAVLLLIQSIYWLYCRRKFDECSFTPSFNKSQFKEIWSFAGWNFFGQTAWILNTQGINMLMNTFFGVVVNAARGIANQVNGVLQQFVSNFMMAMNPQITKSYAAGDKQYAFDLACRGAKFSFYIMLLMSLPIMIEAKQILGLWLINPPENSPEFLALTILSSFTTIVGNTLVTLQMAHGNIKKYQLWITIVGCLPFPLTWLAYQMGTPAITSYFIFFAIYWILIFVRFYLVNSMTGIGARQYLVGVVLRCHVVGFASALLPVLISFVMEPSLLRLILIGVVSVLSTFIVIYTMGVNEYERRLVIGFIRERLLRKWSKKQ